MDGPALLAFRDGGSVYVVRAERVGAVQAGFFGRLLGSKAEGGTLREEWKRIVVRDGRLTVEGTVAPGWWRDEAAALALVGDVVGPMRFVGQGWSLQLPAGWTGLYGDEEPDCLTPPGDEATLQVTCYQREQPVTTEEVQGFASNIHGESQPVRLGPFEGFTGQFRDVAGMRCWIVAHGNKMMFLTWTVEEGVSAPDVLPVIETLRAF